MSMDSLPGDAAYLGMERLLDQFGADPNRTAYANDYDELPALWWP